MGTPEFAVPSLKALSFLEGWEWGKAVEGSAAPEVG